MSKKVIVYTMQYCPYCEMAKRLLTQKGIPFEEKLLEEEDDAAWEKLEKQTGYKTMPQIFIGEKFIGGFNDLSALDQKGDLDAMVK